MEPYHRFLIQVNKERLQKIDIKELKELLQKSEIFTKSMLVDIYDGKKDLFEELPSRGPTAFLNFIQVLKDAGCTSDAIGLEKFQDCNLDINQCSWTSGSCLIINNPKSPNTEPSNVEALDLHDVFSDKWGETVQLFNEKSKADILEIFQNFLTQDFSKVNVCVVIILSYGTVELSQNVIYGNDGQFIKENDFFKMCNDSENLFVVPKLFILPSNNSRNNLCGKLINVPNFTGIYLILWPDIIKTDKLYGKILAECFDDCLNTSNSKTINLNSIVESAFHSFNQSS